LIKSKIIIVILIAISIIAVLVANNGNQAPEEAERKKPEGYIEAMFDGLQDAKELNRKSYEDAKRNAVE